VAPYHAALGGGSLDDPGSEASLALEFESSNGTAGRPLPDAQWHALAERWCCKPWEVAEAPEVWVRRSLLYHGLAIQAQADEADNAAEIAAARQRAYGDR
jgi:hypothetical protein